MISLRRVVTVILGSVMTLALAGARSGQRTQAAEREVFDLLLRGQDSVVLLERTAQFRDPAPTRIEEGALAPPFAAVYRGLPKALIVRLDSVSRESRPVALLDIPRPVTILTDSALRTIFATGIAEGWAEFGRRYPGRDGFMRVSPVAFSTDGTEAMVYREKQCGGLCGDGTLFWFRRSEDGRWRLVGQMMFWIS